jgi:hypothetical protein
MYRILFLLAAVLSSATANASNPFDRSQPISELRDRCVKLIAAGWLDTKNGFLRFNPSPNDRRVCQLLTTYDQVECLREERDLNPGEKYTDGFGYATYHHQHLDYGLVLGCIHGSF